jgi:predicted component of type VI protein secretion system
LSRYRARRKELIPRSRSEAPLSAGFVQHFFDAGFEPLTPLDHEQEMAAQESPRTTKLYYRKKERFTQAANMEPEGMGEPAQQSRGARIRPSCLKSLVSRCRQLFGPPTR